MDTRGRVRDQPPLGLDERRQEESGGVEVVELGPVRNPGSNRSTTLALLLVTGAAILGTLALLPPGEPPSASPGRSGLTGSQTAEPTSPSDVVTPAPTAPRQSSAPPTRNPEAWTRVPIAFGLGQMNVVGLWVVGGRFLALAQVYDESLTPTWVMLTSVSGREWDLAEVPRAVEEVYGSTVVDDELWILARISAVSGSTLELLHTATGADWASLGPIEPFATANAVPLLAHVGDRWVAVPWFESGSPAGIDLFSSTDGVHWTRSDVDASPGTTAYLVLRLGKVIAILGEYAENEVARYSLFTSTDGEAWKRRTLPVELAEGFSQATCSAILCLAYAYHEVVGVYLPVLLATKDFVEWTVVDADPLPETYGIAAAPGGFVALGTTDGLVWLTADGTSWRSVQALPHNMDYGVAGLAVLGDRIVAMTSMSNGQLVAWLGSLEAMGQD